MVSSLRSLWLFFYVEVRRLLHLAWIRFNCMSAQPRWLTSARKPQSRKLLIIGDGFAEGLGDYVVLGQVPGMATHLQSSIRQDARIKMQWTVLNLGKSGTGTSDWLPSEPLFKQTLEHSAYSDADVVLVCLGACDQPPGPKHCTPAATVQNLKKICAAIQESGKRVAVASLVCAHGGTEGGDSDWDGEANKLLKEFVDSQKSDDNPVLLGPMLNAPKLIARSQNVAFDGVHFNSVGYKIAGADAKDAVLAHLKAVEWAEFKSILSADREYIADMKGAMSNPAGAALKKKAA